MQITRDILIELAGSRAKNYIVDGVVEGINEYGEKLHLDNPRRIAFFLGHCVVECGGFSVLVENLNYSASQLQKVWPKRFPNAGTANSYARNPQKIANYVYNGRMNNRDGTDDGWNYRGRGIKQLTGKYNYNEFNKWVNRLFPTAPDFVKNPEQVEQFPWAFLSAAWFWDKNKVYEYADKDDINGSTQAINGGLNGLRDRITFINKAKRLLVNVGYVSVKTTKPKTGDPILKEYQGKLARIATFKGMKEFNPGKIDGWHGKKVDAALKAFQKSTGYLIVDGELGKNTKEAIDNVIAEIDAVQQAPVALMANNKLLDDNEDTAKQAVEITEVPVAIPEELEATKPITQSRSIWAIIGGWGTAIWAFGEKAFDKFSTLPSSTQIAVLVILALAAAATYWIVRDKFRTHQGVEKLKKSVNEVLDGVEGNQ